MRDTWLKWMMCNTEEISEVSRCHCVMSLTGTGHMQRFRNIAPRIWSGSSECFMPKTMCTVTECSNSFVTTWLQWTQWSSSWTKAKTPTAETTVASMKPIHATTLYMTVIEIALVSRIEVLVRNAVGIGARAASFFIAFNSFKNDRAGESWLSELCVLCFIFLPKRIGMASLCNV